MKSFKWSELKGDSPNLICKPTKDSVLRVQQMDSKSYWYSVKINGGETIFDSFFGPTAHLLEEAKTIAQDIYEKFLKGEEVPMMMGNNKII